MSTYQSPPFPPVRQADPANGEQMRNMIHAQLSMMSVFGALMTGATGLPYPVFLLIWFLRPKIRREVEGWNGAR